MAASDFTLDSVKEFMLSHGGKVKNHELVTHFKTYLNDPDRKVEMRDKFKDFVNTLATIKVDEQHDKILVLKRKYRSESDGDQEMSRASSEPPGGPVGNFGSGQDRPDGLAPSKMRSDGNLATFDEKLSASVSSSISLGSGISTSSLSSATVDTGEEDNNMSVVSVKERAKHLNRIESETELMQQTSASSLGATRRTKESKKVKDKEEDDSSTGSGYVTLDPQEKEWLVVSSSSDYHAMHQLLSKQPDLARVKDFTSGHTALHWAAKHGRTEVIKMLVNKPGVSVNQKTNGGYTPLHLAAIHGHEDVIELLIQTFKADPNIRDYSGKKPKQYLKNSASSRAQRKLLSSSCMESCENSLTTSLRSSVNIGSPTDLRSGVTLRSGLTIGPPMDFRSSVNLGQGQGHAFGNASQRSSIRILHLSLSDQAPEGNTSLIETKISEI